MGVSTQSTWCWQHWAHLKVYTCRHSSSRAYSPVFGASKDLISTVARRLAHFRGAAGRTFELQGVRVAGRVHLPGTRALLRCRRLLLLPEELGLLHHHLAHLVHLFLRVREGQSGGSSIACSKLDGPSSL